MTSLSDWHYMPGKHNPVDIATRDVFPEQLENCENQWLGPNRLHQDIYTSKIQIEARLDTTEDLSTLKTQCCLDVNNQTSDFLTKFFFYSKLLRITVWIQRFAHNARISPKLTGPLKVTELNNPCKIIIKIIQNSSFEREIHSLKIINTYRI